MSRPIMMALAVAAALALSGCESSEERAARHYASALALMEEGDVDRALVELRNVFKYDGFHREARQLYADTQLERGEMQDAYGQYLRLIEQYPDALEARVMLARLALETGNWEEVERHGRAAIEIAPDNPEVESLAAALDYRDAVLADDDDLREAALARTAAVLETLPEDRVALRVMIDGLMIGDTPAEALPLIERALLLDPTALDLQVNKYRLLAQGDDDAATEAQLEQMFELFPGNVEVQQALVSWHVGRGDVDSAEGILRSLAEATPADPAGWVTLVRYLQEARGPEAAMAELDRLIAAEESGVAGTETSETGEEVVAGAEDPEDLYRALRAGLDFDAGRRDEAIAAMQAIVDAAPASDQSRQIRGILARMLDGTGNAVGAREQVETILAEDPTNVAALSLRARWAIDDDRPADALTDLRAALGQAPRDSAILTLMAAAHERDGSLDLAGERLALAAEVSGSAPEESLRYAAFLVSQDRPGPARAVLTDARRVSPGDLQVLAATARLALDEEDWTAVEDVLATLTDLDTPEALAMAEGLQTARLMGQDRIEETIARLEAEVARAEAQGGDSAERATAALMLARLRGGDADGARAALDDALADQPDSVPLRLLSADLYLSTGAEGPAEEELASVIETQPGQEEAVGRLHALLMGQGRTDEAMAVLDAALVAEPTSRGLRTLRAVRLEATGEIDDAIAIYEALYEEQSGDLAIANNLASLLGTYRADPADLERAAGIARRLRGRAVPAFQDTFGWIAYRQGNIEAAMENLEPAAAGLPGDPLVQFHLGMAYAAADRVDDARRQLNRALELAGESSLPQFGIARETLAGLPDAAPEPEAAATDDVTEELTPDGLATDGSAADALVTDGLVEDAIDR